MKTLILFCISLFFYNTLFSQNVGIGTTAPKTNLHVAEDHSVLFGKDTIGEGAKMMWIPDLGAFRVGTLDFGTGVSYWDRDSIGEYSFASGRTTKAKGDYSLAMGHASRADADYSIAIGFSTGASGIASTAMGYAVAANGFASTAMGNETEANGNSSFAIGWFTRASGKYSSAMGSFTKAFGKSSTAMGYDTQAQSLNSTALGSYNIGGGNATDWVDDDPIFEIGIGLTEITRNNALTILKDGRNGILTNEPKTSLHVAEDHSVLFGKDTIGEGAKMMWLPDLGAIRVGTVNDNYSSFWDRDSIGEYSFASGFNTRATGIGSTAMGSFTLAKGEYSTAMGNYTDAMGYYSTAMGFNTKAIGSFSTAMGFNTKAIGENSIVIGYFAEASGQGSVAIGYSNEAVQRGSIALGYFAKAQADKSVAIGSSTKAQALSSIAIGSYNIGGGNATDWVEEDPIFEIGNGQIGSRSNALTVLKDGKHGILTNAPKANLHVANDGTAGSGTIVAVLESSISDRPILQFSETPIGDAASGMSIEYNGSGSGSDNKMHFNDVAGTPVVTFESGGQVGLGITSPTFTLQLPNSSSTGVARAHSWSTYSDKRIKSNKQNLNYGLREIMLLKPLSYKQHDASFVNSELQVSDESENTIGFFAQEVHEIIPEAAIKPENENEQLWGMEYEKLIPVLVKGMQEQQAEIELLKEEIKKLTMKKENQQSATVQNQSSLFTKADNKK